ncbi:MAG: YecA family protein [Gammaproteobacteria bacterium]|nr:MAG: YecA family protein [Gammaproteobacteria bacterium]
MTQAPGSVFEHAVLAQAVNAAGITLAAAEVHGIIAGVLCAAPEPEQASEWVSIVLDERESGREQEVETLSRLLIQLHGRLLLQLRGAEFGLKLLLPDDEVLLSERIDALGEWCRGYMLGLVVGGVEDLHALPGAAAEASQDILGIAEVDYENATPDDEAERDLLELQEFVRMAVQTVFDEIHPGAHTPEKNTGNTLH